MQDLIGNSLSIGDTVVYITVPYGKSTFSHRTAIVTNIKEDTQKVQIRTPYMNNGKYYDVSRPSLVKSSSVIKISDNEYAKNFVLSCL